MGQSQSAVKGTLSSTPSSSSLARPSSNWSTSTASRSTSSRSTPSRRPSLTPSTLTPSTSTFSTSTLSTSTPKSSGVRTRNARRQWSSAESNTGNEENVAPRETRSAKRAKTEETPKMASIDEEMEEDSIPRLSCCNGPQRQRFHTANEKCHEDEECRIAPGVKYYVYEYNKRKYCMSHHANFIAPYTSTEMPADQKARYFVKKFNENPSLEEILRCGRCGREVHRICVLYVGLKSRFSCDQCDGSVRPSFGPTHLEPKSSKFITDKLNKFLKNKAIIVRTFTSEGTSTLESLVPKSLLSAFQDKFPSSMDYKKRAIYVFQEQAGIAVPFFAMFCREYSQADFNWFVIDYLDTVPYFRGERDQRRQIYPRILLAYFDYMRAIGILGGFLWADPPVQGDDYVFNIHPDTQKYKSKTDLINWYRSVFSMGKKEKVIKEYRDFQHKKFKMVSEIPPFEGSLWVKAMKEVEKEVVEKEGTKSEDMAAKIEKKMRVEFRDHPDDNFFLELEPTKTKEKDDDFLNENNTLIDRVKVLDLCQRKNWEFGTERHARFSSVALSAWIKEEDENKKKKESRF